MGHGCCGNEKMCGCELSRVPFFLLASDERYNEEHRNNYGPNVIIIRKNGADFYRTLNEIGHLWVFLIR